MQVREEFLNKYNKMNVIETELPNKKIKGLYKRDKHWPDGLVLIDGSTDYYLQNGILAEEIGHHETSYGNLLNAYTKQSTDHVDKLRQELRARRHGYKLAVPLEKLIKCYKQGIWGDLYEMCLSMQIDRSYFEKVIDDYQKQFGNYVEYDGYLIHFKPLYIREVRKNF
ncbi:hypothetical protein AB6F13_01340 [Staphylococcus saprophyticus]|uniref:hypothetical protein n=1 Tax=Staphylococcus saprophyticus TaxID=29385 RepID=UPI0034DCE0E1